MASPELYGKGAGEHVLGGLCGSIGIPAAESVIADAAYARRQGRPNGMLATGQPRGKRLRKQRRTDRIHVVAAVQSAAVQIGKAFLWCDPCGFVVQEPRTDDHQMQGVNAAFQGPCEGINGSVVRKIKGVHARRGCARSSNDASKAGVFVQGACQRSANAAACADNQRIGALWKFPQRDGA